VHVTSSDPTVANLFAQAYQYQVPTYQRPYSWERDQIDELWSDLTRTEGEHFLGPMVLFDPGGDGVREVIDGQQRLTTLQVLIALIRDAHIAITGNENPGLHSLIEEQQYEGTRFRLRTGLRNQKVLETYILRSPGSEERRNLDDPLHLAALSKAERLHNQPLIDAWKRLGEKLATYLAQGGPDQVGTLKSFQERIVKQVRVVVLDVSSLDDAFLLFETLNDRGLRLTSADLLKSHLLKRLQEQEANPAALIVAAGRWDDMVDDLGGGDITAFLRHSLLSRHGKVGRADVYARFKEELRGGGGRPPRNPSELLESLVKASDHYAQFLTPPTTEGPEYRSVLADLNGTGVDAHRVALLPARAWLPIPRFVLFARAAEALSFRWKITGGNAQELEGIYQRAAQMLDESKGARANEAQESLLDALPADEFFRSALEQQSLGTQYVAKYALRRIEEWTNPGELEIKAGATVHLEHLMPQTRTPYWAEVVPEDDLYATVVQRWGNLTLLLDRLNIQISNGDWQTKRFGTPPARRGLAASKIGMTVDIATIPSWSEADIALRGRWLAAVGARVWSASSRSEVPPFSAVRDRPELLNQI